MADEKFTPSLEQALITVEGWASTNWCRDTAAPVVVSPDATPLDLLSWGIGQLEQTVILMSIIGCSEDGGVNFAASEVAGAFRHPTEQALKVLRAAADKLFESEGR